MGFFRHNSDIVEQKKQQNTINIKDYCTKKIDELLNKNSSDLSIYEDNLALNQPVRFINRYLNCDTIKNAIKCNPNISEILKENKLSLNFELKNVSSIIMSHLVPTCKTAQKLYLKMGFDKTDSNFLYLTQAALLHDIGKIFIPSEILNKKGRLTGKERQIIELHNILSYEIIKTTNLHPKVAQLALEHHDYNKKVIKTKENQALTIADVYCALKEKRPYKNPINDISARMILYDMGTKGSLDARYISLLNA